VAFPVACRRCRSSLGFQKATGRIQEIVRKRVASTGLRLQVSGDVEFLWPKDIEPSRYRLFRVNGLSRDISRNVEEIPLEELANAFFIFSKRILGCRSTTYGKLPPAFSAFSALVLPWLPALILLSSICSKRHEIVDKNGILSLP